MRTAKKTMGRMLALSALACCALLSLGAAGALAAVPAVTTVKGTNVTDTTATLTGRLRTDSTLTDCHFEYVTVTAFRETGFLDLSSGGTVACTPAAASIPTDSLAHDVSGDIVRSDPDEAIVFRLLATNVDGTATGIRESVGFGIELWDGGAFTGITAGDRFPIGLPETQAGSHPATASAKFQLTPLLADALRNGFKDYSTEEFKDVFVDLPPGVIGNPEAISEVCTELQLNTPPAPGSCPKASQVGFLKILFPPNQLGGGDQLLGRVDYDFVPLTLLTPPYGTAALLGFNYLNAIFYISAELVRDDSVPGRYRVRVSSINTPQAIPLRGADTVVWGVPADPDLDIVRGWGPAQDNHITAVDGTFRYSGSACASPSSAGESTCPPTQDFSVPGPPRPFFTLPTSCVGFDGAPGTPIRTDITVTSWQGSEDSTSFLSHDLTTPVPNPQPITGCAALDTGFRPTLKARPTTNVADSPTGLEVELTIPQNDDPDGLSTAHLRDTTVTLPEGLVVNPSSANGLGACSPAQIDLGSEDPAVCPDASKLAEVQVDTPLLDHPVMGATYIATPYDNPFGSLLAIYIAFNDPQSGTVVKVAGEVRADPRTGQLTTTVEENPQVPFETFTLDFKAGPHASLRTPATCDADPSTPAVDPYTTTSSLTPWSFPDSGAPKTPSDTWAITQNPAGGSCANTPAQQPNAPSFDAGVVSPIAGTHSPFVVNLRREDGSQNFSAVTVKPPQGLVAKLVGTEICGQGALDAAASKSGNQERASPSCPAASEVGDVTAAAGAGPAPYYAPAKAYMSGPYKGAPLSMAVITPATAGPFDLGTIVTRIALQVDPKTAEITAVSDPLPSILQGIPLDVRSVHVALDKPNFSLNPTSCDPMAVRGLLTSTIGALANLESRFQLAECKGMGFKPRMVLTLRGGTKRGKHPALTVALMPRPGDANIASVSLALPRSEFLENAHIRTICTRPDFAADNCPAAAIYGESTVDTPLLDYDLAGHVYLRSSDNLLPDVVPDLRGPAYQPIRLESAGRTDSIRGGIRTTIDFVPDAPFTKAVIAMQGGNKGLLVNSRNICDRIYRATVRYTAHNGKTHVARPALKAKCGKKAKRGRRRAHRRR
jgi:hypothetical protein